MLTIFMVYLMCYFFPVNSEANTRRIAMVEGCFGSSGQVSKLKFYVFKY